MTVPITLRIRQKGYIRPEGYQATQWAVTVPVSDPPGSPPIATDPSNLAAMFVMRDVNGLETFERVATIQDFSLAYRTLTWFDIKGAGGNLVLAGAATGDKLTINDAPSWWYESDPPYDVMEFTVAQVIQRIQCDASCFVSPQGLQISQYTLTPEDIGRWVYLESFTDSGNNGWAQILSYLGTVAQVSKVFTSAGAGTAAFRVISIDPNGSGLEPKFFPTKENNLLWKFERGTSFLFSGDGGATLRNDFVPNTRFLTTRVTTVMPTAQAAEDLFRITRQQVDDLQRAATQVQEPFLDLITHTIGP
jgi:hypothetical protein